MAATAHSEMTHSLKGGVAIDISSADHAVVARALWVGTAGNVKVDTADGTALTFNNVQDGTLLPIDITNVYKTGTTASNMVAGW